MDHLRLHIREDPIQNFFLHVTVLFQLTTEDRRHVNDCMPKQSKGTKFCFFKIIYLCNQ